MCGRYVLRGVALLRASFEASEEFHRAIDEFSEHGRSMPRQLFNIAPSQQVPIVRINSHGQRIIDQAQWGFVPSWTKGKPKIRPINAKSETIATSPMFRAAFSRRRCLIPADGFYEWHGPKPPKQPYFIHRPDDSLFAFAGLYDRWNPEAEAEGGEAEEGGIETCTIITTAANETMKPIHSRMPVILHRRDYAHWLDREIVGDGVMDLMEPFDGELVATPVSTKVNSVKNDGPELLE